MKTLFSLFMISAALSCGSNQDNTNAQTSNPAKGTIEETTAVQQEEPSPLQEPSAMPVGEINRYDLSAAPHSAWFNTGFENYEAAPEVLEKIKNNITDYEIVAFMGTWCPDSRREVPHFFKILELADVNPNQVTMYGVNRRKATPDHLELEYNISHVPTFIFYKDGEEVGRFVEYPQESLGEDIAKIVSNEEYHHSYE